MKHSLQVFVPEMSLSDDFPKTKEEMEREIGIADRDASKPLLLRLIEQVKFGAPPATNPSLSTQDRGASKSEVLTFGSNQSSSEQKPSD